MDGSQIDEASYETVIKMIDSAELDDLKPYICPKDGRLGISNEAVGTVKLCFVVSKDFEPDVISFRAGVGWQIVPLQDPSLACESHRDFCNKSGEYVISEEQPEPEPDMIEQPSVVYNANDGELVVFWSDPMILFSAEDLLFTDRGAVKMSLDDYTYDVVDTVMWFKFSDSVVAQIGEANHLTMLISDDTVRGYNGTKVHTSAVDVIIIN